jgi:RNA polymerase sigma-70 factor, ECF subfamily
MTHVTGSANCEPRTRVSASRSRGSRELKKNMHLPGGPAEKRPCPVVPFRPEDRWQAFEGMFLASRPEFIRLAYGILRNSEDAEDAVQDALLSTYVHLRSFEGRSALKTWFTRVVVNASLMIRRKRRPARNEFIPELPGAGNSLALDRLPASKPDPEMRYGRTEALERIAALISKLSPTLREALTMTYFDEMSPKIAGALSGVTAGTFKSRLSRAKRYLRRHARQSIAVPIRSATRLPFFRSKTEFSAATPAELSSRATAV